MEMDCLIEQLTTAKKAKQNPLKVKLPIRGEADDDVVEVDNDSVDDTGDAEDSEEGAGGDPCPGRPDSAEEEESPAGCGVL